MLLLMLHTGSVNLSKILWLNLQEKFGAQKMSLLTGLYVLTVTERIDKKKIRFWVQKVFKALLNETFLKISRYIHMLNMHPEIAKNIPAKNGVNPLLDTASSKACAK